MHITTVNHASVCITGVDAFSLFSRLGGSAELADAARPNDLELVSTDQGLRLVWNRPDAQALNYHLDFEKQARRLRSFPAPKQGAFNQALGNKTKTVIDATGGWGGDAILMCLQGYRVIVIERLSIMAVLLSDAFSRLERSQWALDNNVVIPKVVYGDAKEMLPRLSGDANCVYLDPMFPPKKKKAASNKQMQLLQWLAGADSDAVGVASIAKQNFLRLVVKRPDYATPLLAKPNTRFSSKLVHYDVYLGN